MSTPSSSTDPASCAPGTTSCIRFRIRRNVDFPHPEGPIKAVTCERAMVRSTSLSTSRPENQAQTPLASTCAAEKPDVGPGLSVATAIFVCVPSYGFYGDCVRVTGISGLEPRRPATVGAGREEPTFFNQPLFFFVLDRVRPAMRAATKSTSTIDISTKPA